MVTGPGIRAHGRALAPPRQGVSAVRVWLGVHRCARLCVFWLQGGGEARRGGMRNTRSFQHSQGPLCAARKGVVAAWLVGRVTEAAPPQRARGKARDAAALLSPLGEPAQAVLFRSRTLPYTLLPEEKKDHPGPRPLGPQIHCGWSPFWSL